jgi:energy-converting hydrogenase Eha subunit B
MSMSISSISSTSPFAGLTTTNQSQDSTNPLLNSLSSTLGLSGSQIETDLAGGASLSSIASAQGVAQSTLLSAVQNSLSSGPGASSMSSSQLSSIANTIVNTTGLPPMPGSGSFGTSNGSGSSESPEDQLFSSLSSTLGLSASQIQTDLSGGASLSSIASSQGVSQSTLLSAVESTISSGPMGSSMSSGDISSMANTIVNTVGLPQPPGSGSTSSSDNSDSSSSSSVSTDTMIKQWIEQQQSQSSSSSNIYSEIASAYDSMNTSDAS